MANGLKIKRGDGTPVAGSDGSNGVWPFELAYDYTNNKLYINDGQGGGNGNMQEIGGGTITSVSGMTNNNVLTASGSTTISGEGSLTFDGTNLDLPNSKKIRLGDSQDLEIYHDGTNSVINNTQTGALQIYNNVDNGMVELLTDNGSGGTQVFLRADGANNMVRMPVDGVKFTLGDASDLQLYHDGSNNYLRNNTTNQDFSILVNDGGTTKTALTIDSSENALITTHGNLTVGGQVNIQDTNAIVKRNSGQMELLTYGGYNIDLNPAGDVRIDGASLVFKNNAEYIYNTDASGTSTRMFGINGSNHTYIGPIDNYAGGLVLYGTNSNVTGHIFYSGGAERWRITSSGTLQGNNKAITGIGGVYGNGGDLTLYNNTYNFKSSTSADLMKLTTTGLGIGTTSPAHEMVLRKDQAAETELSIVNLTSNSSAKTNLRFRNATSGSETGNGGLIQLTNGNDFKILNQFGNNLILGTSNAEKMRISSAGLVGIGATNPLRNLHVVGSLAVNEATDQYYGVLMGGGEGNDPKITIGDWHNSSGSIMWDSSANVLQIDSQHSGARDIVFTGNDGATEYMRLTGTGRLGIGTNSPDMDLHINTTDDGSVMFSRGGGHKYSIEHDTSQFYLYNRTLNKNVIEFDHSGPVTINEQGHSTIDFRVEGDTDANLFFTDASANAIGVGTSSPNAKFHVSHNGSAVIKAEATANGYGAYSRLTTTTNSYSLYSLNGDFGIDEDSVATRFIIKDSTGHVGFNETSPTTELHLGTCPDARTITFDQSGRFNGIGSYFSSNAADSQIWFHLSTGGTDGGENVRMKVYADGRLKLVNSANAEMTLAKATRMGYSASYKALVLGETSGTYTTAIAYDPSTNASSAFTGDGREVIFRNGVEFTTPNAANNGFHNDVVVLKDGSVGVGSATPGALFTVRKDGTQASSVSTSYQIQTVSNSNGGIAIQAGASSDAFLVFGDNGQYDAGRIRYHNDLHHMDFCTGGNNPRLTLQDDGHIAITNAKRLIFDGVDGNTYINQNNGSSSRLDFTVNGAGIMDLYNTFLRINGYLDTKDIYVEHGGSDFSPGINFLGGSDTAGSNAYENATIAYHDNSGTGLMRFAINRGAGNFDFLIGGNRSFLATTTYLAVPDNHYLAAGDNNEVFIRHDGNGHFQSNGGQMYINNVATTNIIISVGNDEKVRIENDGDLHVKADVVAYSSTPSDIRLKKNFTKIDNGLDVINKLDGQTFNWKKDEGRLSAGFKAQEVEKVLPHLVDERELPLHSDDEKDYKVLRYEELIPYLVEAIKEQQVQIDELKTKLGE